MSQPRKLKIATFATITALCLVCPSPEGVARNDTSHRDPASTQHITELPPEIVKAVNRWQSVCGTPLAARHSFAHYLENQSSRYRLVSLHFHELSCDNRAAICNNQGCLHQVYISADHTYHLAFSANVLEATLRFIDDKPSVEIDCYQPQCPRILRWNGRRAVSVPTTRRWSTLIADIVAPSSRGMAVAPGQLVSWLVLRVGAPAAFTMV
jgi:hypothetical protein